MTLNITLTTPRYVIQASDRRMVSIPGGQIVDDEANKGLVLQADDGIFAITFAGVGQYRGNRVDHWLAERLLDEGVPELPMREGVTIIGRAATNWFRTFSRSVDRRHTFVLAGWVMSGAVPRPGIWSISNCEAPDGSRLEQAKDEFDVEELRRRGSGANLYAFGLHQALTRSERRRFQAAVRRSPDLDGAEEAIVGMIRAAAGRPEWCWGINGNVLAIALAPNAQARATYYPASAPTYNYAPLFVWYEGGHNVAAGDARIDLQRNFAYRLGRTVLVGFPGGAGSQVSLPVRDKVQMQFTTRLSKAKHKTEPPADKGIFVEIIPLK